VPEENREALAEFCDRAQLTGEDDISTAVKKLEEYYQDNIPYTIRPGITPYQKDFVNYFLQENKRGYCAHFASAATLIFRYLGIPARYVEGYALDAEDISQEGTIEYEEQYEDYYQGTSLIDSRAVVSVNITDANAHAWVEVYDSDLGWQVADVTPASAEEEEDNGFWQRLLNILGGSKTGGEDAQTVREQKQKNAVVSSETGKRAGAGILIFGAFLFTIFIVKWSVKGGIRLAKYLRAGYNDKLVMEYHCHLARVLRRDRQLRQESNYRQQIQWMMEHGYWNDIEMDTEQAIARMEQAGFSNRQLTRQEYFQVKSCFRGSRK
jgi:hypothetical protein